MVKRYGLRDGQWEKIETLLPGRDGTVGVTAKDHSRSAAGLLALARSNILALSPT